MEKPVIDILENRRLWHSILSELPNFAIVDILENGYVFGKVESNLFRKLKNTIEDLYSLKLKDSPKEIGHHISIYYEDEEKNGYAFEKGKQFNFAAHDIAKAQILGRKFFVILVRANYVTSARVALKLSKYPVFKGISVPLHITIGEVL